MKMKKLCLALSIASIVGLSLLSSCAKHAPRDRRPVVQLTSQTQLFVDDFLIDRTEGVWRAENRPNKFEGNPVMRADKPWEGYLALQPGTVLL